MTDLLWMPAFDALAGASGIPNPNYVREFEARVQKTLEDWVLLDRTAFYAEGGGQPSDRGRIVWDGGEASVRHVSKRGAVKHYLEGGKPPAGAIVRGTVDWELRYKHMRMHTSQHALSALAWRLFGARTLANDIRAEATRIEIDRPLPAQEASRLESEMRDLAAKDARVRIYEEERGSLEARLRAEGLADRVRLDLLPASVRTLRVVEVVDVDVCPCAGTHVASTRELGRLEVTDRESLPPGKTAVTYTLR